MSSAWTTEPPTHHPPTVRVKICGITSQADAWAAVDAGADALGFMFYRPSPRFLEIEAARTIIASLPPFIARVGVFVDASSEDIRRHVESCGIDTVQLHGRENPEFCSSLAPVSVVKAFRVPGFEILETLKNYPGMAWLLDSYVPGAPGGTGQTFNWEVAARAVRGGGRVILAGGLTAANVAAAVSAVKPMAVDVSSGVESAPGRKDPARMRDFIAAAKATAAS